MISDSIYLIANNNWLFLTLIFILSLLVGSFLNVVIYRLPIILNNAWRSECQEFLHPEIEFDKPAHYTLSSPGSACPKCNTKIKWYYNIPVFSWLALKGKCNICKSRIGLKYPLIEFATAVLSVLVAWKFDATIQCVFALALTWMLIPLVFIDFAEQILPDRLVFPLLGLGLLAGANNVFISAEQSIYGALIGFSILWGICQVFKLITKKEGMGFGDLKLFATAGAWFGALALPNMLVIAAGTGALIGIALLIIKKGESLPYAFGPYIALGMWITLMTT